MEKITIDLQKDRIRPVVEFMGLNALIDSGADISVCNLTANVFELIFEYESKTRSHITGFGGKCEGYGYLVKKINVGTETFYDVPFFVPDVVTSEENFVISGSVFQNYAYEIDMKNHVMTLRKV